MRIKIPQQVVAGTEIFEVWANVPLHQHGRSEIRRLDILIVVLGILCVIYYGWTGGWFGALTGALAYMLVTMTALWFLR